MVFRNKYDVKATRNPYHSEIKGGERKSVLTEYDAD
jgi:hypothetical protein